MGAVGGWTEEQWYAAAENLSHFSSLEEIRDFLNQAPESCRRSRLYGSFEAALHLRPMYESVLLAAIEYAQNNPDGGKTDMVALLQRLIAALR